MLRVCSIRSTNRSLCSRGWTFQGRGNHPKAGEASDGVFPNLPSRSPFFRRDELRRGLGEPTFGQAGVALRFAVLLPGGFGWKPSLPRRIMPSLRIGATGGVLPQAKSGGAAAKIVRFPGKPACALLGNPQQGGCGWKVRSAKAVALLARERRLPRRGMKVCRGFKGRGHARFRTGRPRGR